MQLWITEHVIGATNYDDVLDQLRSIGLIVDDLRVGRMTRCALADDREKRGWYMLHELQTSKGDLLIVGSFGVWRGNDNGACKVELRKSEISREQRDALRRRLAEDKRRVAAERKAENAKAARRAAAAWKKCATTGESAYLVRKGVRALGIRFAPSGAAVIPVMDTAGVVHGLQVIRTAAQAKARHRREKEFWPTGVAKKGHFHLIGMPTWIVLVAEGYATAASLHDATQLPVAVAFDANNIGPVASALHKRYKTVKILICADDDMLAKCVHCGERLILADHPTDCPKCLAPHTRINTGVDAASAAALEVNGAWIRPTFTDEAKRRDTFLSRGIKLTDFNDLAQAETTNVVRQQVEAHLSELGWYMSTREVRASHSEGAGREDLHPIEALGELLDRFALVYGKGGLVFDRSEHMLLSLQDVGHACASRGNYKTWGEHPDRVIVREREVGFDPGNDDPLVSCNLWGGWPTTPKSGNCEILLELLRFMCSKEHKAHALFEFVLRWCAYPIQHPGAKMKTALVFHGPSGVGKNMFFEALMAVYGEYGAVIDQNAIDDKFTDWAERKLFLLADEVVARKELYYVKNKLKSLITGDWIRINPKTYAAHNERNHVNLVFLSNESQPVVLEEDDRRYAVIWTPAKYQALPSGGRADDVFYKRLRNATRDPDVIAALHDHLRNIDLGDFDPGTLPPHTDAKFELVSLSLDSPSSFFYALTSGDIRGIPCCPALSIDVYECYRIWCARTGERTISQPRFINMLSRKHKIFNARKYYLDFTGARKGPHGMLMLGNEECPPGTDECGWLGSHVAQFNAALKDMRGGLFHD